MKNLPILSVIFLFLCLSCNQDQENLNSQEKEELIFALDLIQKNKNERIINTLPAGATIRLSVQDLKGTPLLTNEVIKIIKFNNDWITEPLFIAAGEYILSEFMILSQDNEILYAIPLEDSPLANLVSKPLPLSFEIIPNEINNISLELLNATNLSPSDIGYAAFPFKLVDYFFLSVFEPTKSGQILTDAEVHILQNSDTLKTFSILPEVNTLSFNRVDSGEFTLVVIKNGFAKYTKDFTVDEIYENYENALIPIQLIPAFTFVSVPIFYEGGTNTGPNFEISLGYNGNISIDWGDGIIEDYTTNGNATYDDFIHTYEKEGFYFVSVTGDYQSITDFYSFYSAGPINEINLNLLPELVDFRLGFLGSLRNPKIVDFSYNHKLRYINMPKNNYLEQIIISEENNIISLSIAAPNRISTEALEAIISKIYDSVLLTHRENGYITLSLESEIEETLTGPPSELTIEQLKILRDNFGWSITPELELL